MHITTPCERVLQGWVHEIPISRDLVTIRKVPLPHAPSINTPATLSVDVAGDALQGLPRISGINVGHKLPNISDEHSITRLIQLSSQPEEQASFRSCSYNKINELAS